MTKLSISASLIIASVMVFFISCSKEDSNDTSQSFRVTEIISDFSNGSYDSVHIQYNGEQISSYHMHFESATLGVSESRLDFTYPDAGSIIMSFYVKDSSGNWVLSSRSKSEKSWQGNEKIVKSYSERDNAWYPVTGYISTYVGDSPEKIEHFNLDDNGDTTYWWKETFSYQNQLLKEMIYTFKNEDDWVNHHKEVADFIGDQVGSITFQYFNIATNQWEDRFLNSYQYSNNKLQKKKNFVFQDESWLPSNEEYEFGYDVEGNLIYQHWVGFGAEVNKTYKYEKGKGNYDELFISNDFSIENSVVPRVTIIGRMKENYMVGVEGGKKSDW